MLIAEVCGGIMHLTKYNILRKSIYYTFSRIRRNLQFVFAFALDVHNSDARNDYPPRKIMYTRRGTQEADGQRIGQIQRVGKIHEITVFINAGVRN